ncbi:MAG: hypothetical protein KAJ23_06235 [Maribacter sp.]|nr:hypothetical protein [Maribacter sp.]
MKKVISYLFVLSLFSFTACSEQETLEHYPLDEARTTLLQQLSSTALMTSKRPQPPIWADCILYSGIVVPATFKPESDPFDELYALPEGSTYKDGVPLISDSKPGDQDYNGGRWHLNVLKEGVDPAKYANACQSEDLDPADFMATDNYFGCPLRPRKN